MGRSWSALPLSGKENKRFRREKGIWGRSGRNCFSRASVSGLLTGSSSNAGGTSVYANSYIPAFPRFEKYVLIYLNLLNDKLLYLSQPSDEMLV